MRRMPVCLSPIPPSPCKYPVKDLGDSSSSEEEDEISEIADEIDNALEMCQDSLHDDSHFEIPNNGETSPRSCQGSVNDGIPLKIPNQHEHPHGTTQDLLKDIPSVETLHEVKSPTRQFQDITENITPLEGANEVESQPMEGITNESQASLEIQNPVKSPTRQCQDITENITPLEGAIEAESQDIANDHQTSLEISNPVNLPRNCKDISDNKTSLDVPKEVESQPIEDIDHPSSSEIPNPVKSPTKGILDNTTSLEVPKEVESQPMQEGPSRLCSLAVPNEAESELIEDIENDNQASSEIPNPVKSPTRGILGNTTFLEVLKEVESQPMQEGPSRFCSLAVPNEAESEPIEDIENDHQASSEIPNPVKSPTRGILGNTTSLEIPREVESQPMQEDSSKSCSLDLSNEAESQPIEDIENDCQASLKISNPVKSQTRQCKDITENVTPLEEAVEAESQDIANDHQPSLEILNPLNSQRNCKDISDNTTSLEVPNEAESQPMEATRQCKDITDNPTSLEVPTEVESQLMEEDSTRSCPLIVPNKAESQPMEDIEYDHQASLEISNPVKLPTRQCKDITENLTSLEVPKEVESEPMQEDSSRSRPLEVLNEAESQPMEENDCQASLEISNAVKSPTINCKDISDNTTSLEVPNEAESQPMEATRQCKDITENPTFLEVPNEAQSQPKEDIANDCHASSEIPTPVKSSHSEVSKSKMPFINNTPPRMTRSRTKNSNSNCTENVHISLPMKIKKQSRRKNSNDQESDASEDVEKESNFTLEKAVKVDVVNSEVKNNFSELDNSNSASEVIENQADNFNGPNVISTLSTDVIMKNNKANNHSSTNTVVESENTTQPKFNWNSEDLLINVDNEIEETTENVCEDILRKIVNDVNCENEEQNCKSITNLSPLQKLVEEPIAESDNSICSADAKSPVEDHDIMLSEMSDLDNGDSSKTDVRDDQVHTSLVSPNIDGITSVKQDFPIGGTTKDNYGNPLNSSDLFCDAVHRYTEEVADEQNSAEVILCNQVEIENTKYDDISKSELPPDLLLEEELNVPTKLESSTSEIPDILSKNLELEEDSEVTEPTVTNADINGLEENLKTVEKNVNTKFKTLSNLKQCLLSLDLSDSDDDLVKNPAKSFETLELEKDFEVTSKELTVSTADSKLEEDEKTVEKKVDNELKNLSDPKKCLPSLDLSNSDDDFEKNPVESFGTQDLEVILKEPTASNADINEHEQVGKTVENKVENEFKNLKECLPDSDDDLEKIPTESFLTQELEKDSKVTSKEPTAPNADINEPKQVGKTVEKKVENELKNLSGAKEYFPSSDLSDSDDDLEKNLTASCVMESKYIDMNLQDCRDAGLFKKKDSLQTNLQNSPENKQSLFKQESETTSDLKETQTFKNSSGTKKLNISPELTIAKNNLDFCLENVELPLEVVNQDIDLKNITVNITVLQKNYIVDSETVTEKRKSKTSVIKSIETICQQSNNSKIVSKVHIKSPDKKESTTKASSKCTSRIGLKNKLGLKLFNSFVKASDKKDSSNIVENLAVNSEATVETKQRRLTRSMCDNEQVTSRQRKTSGSTFKRQLTDGGQKTNHKKRKHSVSTNSLKNSTDFIQDSSENISENIPSCSKSVVNPTVSGNLSNTRSCFSKNDNKDTSINSLPSQSLNKFQSSAACKCLQFGVEEKSKCDKFSNQCPKNIIKHPSKLNSGTPQQPQCPFTRAQRKTSRLVSPIPTSPNFPSTKGSSRGSTPVLSSSYRNLPSLVPIPIPISPLPVSPRKYSRRNRSPFPNQLPRIPISPLTLPSSTKRLVRCSSLSVEHCISPIQDPQPSTPSQVSRKRRTAHRPTYSPGIIPYGLASSSSLPVSPPRIHASVPEGAVTVRASRSTGQLSAFKCPTPDATCSNFQKMHPSNFNPNSFLKSSPTQSSFTKPIPEFKPSGALKRKSAVSSQQSSLKRSKQQKSLDDQEQSAKVTQQTYVKQGKSHSSVMDEMHKQNNARSRKINGNIWCEVANSQQNWGSKKQTRKKKKVKEKKITADVQRLNYQINAERTLALNVEDRLEFLVSQISNVTSDVTASQAVMRLISFLVLNDVNLLPVLKSMSEKNNKSTKLLITPHEEMLIKSVMDNKNINLNGIVLDDLKRAIFSLKDLEVNKDKIVVAMTLCRWYTALCCSKGVEYEDHVRILLYDIINEKLDNVPQIVLSIVSVWPAILKKDSSSPVDATIKSIVLHQLQRQIEQGQYSAIVLQNCFKVLYDWQVVSIPCLSKVCMDLVSKLMNDKTCGVFTNTEGDSILSPTTYDLVKAIELVACQLSWDWNKNQLIEQNLWPMIEHWKLNLKESDDSKEGLICAALQIIGELSAIGILDTLDSELLTKIGLLLQSNITQSVSWNIQMFAVKTVIGLSPCNPKLARKVIGIWLSHSQCSLPDAVHKAISILSGDST
ncbi:uncharacterized protein [Antedon mediterranea]|uniref:uncharacterized protein n=1 Tax=Antedon mediterranea TaxID=105859 RepID=UPI003AF553F7